MMKSNSFLIENLLVLGLIIAAFFGFAAIPTKAQAQVPNPVSTCSGKFVNPITDICWSCLFPLSIGPLDIWPSSRPDTKNPALPICACGTPVPRIGLSIGFWEPARLVDVTHKPWCFPNLGGIKIDPGLGVGHGQSTGPLMGGGRTANTANYHVHYYIYPLLYWMELLTDFLCFEQASIDIAYISEIDPLWNDSQLTALINPEAILFANIPAQAACAADCAAATAKLPIDQLFWCAGCQGASYPMNGQIAAHVSRVQSSRLAAERMLAKMHRMGLAWGTAGKKALCSKYIMPIVKRSQYRIQMTNPISTTKGRFACSTIGATTMMPTAGRAYPVKGEDMGYLIWRKRNCCML
tara:strand:- start:47523 stop:48578 length:1056 start_codon:yes stop_codon:yes gene_type:complete